MWGSFVFSFLASPRKPDFLFSDHRESDSCTMGNQIPNPVLPTLKEGVLGLQSFPQHARLLTRGTSCKSVCSLIRTTDELRRPVPVVQLPKLLLRLYMWDLLFCGFDSDCPGHFLSEGLSGLATIGQEFLQA